MKELDLARLLSHIDPQLIAQAADAYPQGPHYRKRLPLRLLLAAIIVIFVTFTTALAVNKEFRDTVTDFVFTVFQRKPTPEPSLASASPLTIQSFVPSSNRNCFGNLIYDTRTNTYYTATDTGLIPQETTHVDTYMELFNRRWKVIFDYAVIDGELAMYSDNSQERSEEEIATGIYPTIISPVAGTTDTVLLRMTLYDFRTIFYGYLVRYNFVTGTIEEPLAGNTLMDIPHAAGFVEPNESLTGAIATVYLMDGHGVYYYCDLTTGECWPVSELTGRCRDVEAECLQVSDAEVDCRWICDDTLLLTTRDDALAEVIRYNVRTKETTTVLEQFDPSTPNYQLSSRCWLLNGPSGSYILDCLTGQQYPLNGQFSYVESASRSTVFSSYGILSDASGALWLFDPDAFAMTNLNEVYPELPKHFEKISFLGETWCCFFSESHIYLAKLPAIPLTPLAAANT